MFLGGLAATTSGFRLESEPIRVQWVESLEWVSTHGVISKLVPLQAPAATVASVVFWFTPSPRVQRTNWPAGVVAGTIPPLVQSQLRERTTEVIAAVVNSPVTFRSAPPTGEPVTMSARCTVQSVPHWTRKTERFAACTRFGAPAHRRTRSWVPFQVSRAETEGKRSVPASVQSIPPPQRPPTGTTWVTEGSPVGKSNCCVPVPPPIDPRERFIVPFNVKPEVEVGWRHSTTVTVPTQSVPEPPRPKRITLDEPEGGAWNPP